MHDVRVIKVQARSSQWQRISFKSSSSSDSDSDSNATQKKSIRNINKVTKTENTDIDKLHNLLFDMMQQKQVKSNINVNIALKQDQRTWRNTGTDSNRKLNFTEQLTQAASNAAANFNVNQKSVASELINKYSQTERHKRFRNYETERVRPIDSFNKYGISSSPIFKDNYEHRSDMPVLKTWNALQEAQVSMMVTHYPDNAFQEMIQWTEEGKLWKFPIDNYQGMEEEENVHFSEHIFMERHLKNWCPKRGPIRHFMELVCVGLSKNPYMTVQEKIEHIMWYKNYFDGKKDLLEKLGAIDVQVPETTNDIKVK